MINFFWPKLSAYPVGVVGVLDTTYRFAFIPNSRTGDAKLRIEKRESAYEDLTTDALRLPAHARFKL